MTDDTTEQNSRITYPHPSDIDLDPVDVGPAAAAQLREAALSTAEHAVAVGRQVRSSYMSQRLAAEPTTSAHDLGEQWGRSTEARMALGMVRAAHAYERAATALAQRLEA